MTLRYEVIEDFSAKTPEGTKEIKKGQIVKLSEQSASQLIEAGKIMPMDKFECYFMDTTKKINQNYPSGVLDYARGKHPERFQESLRLEDRINSFWGNDFTEFQKTCNDWWYIHLEFLKLFKNSEINS